MMQYGSRTTVTQTPSGVLVSTEEKFFDWEMVKQVVWNTESVKVKSEKQALAQFLLLLDRYKTGEISDFAINCVSGRDGQLMRVEKSWVEADLR